MENDFDKAARFAARLDAQLFLRWLLRLGEGEMLFHGWLDARTIVFPGEPDRTCDTVARLDDVQRGGIPWAVPIEFQLTPDAEMFGRFLEYLGKVWRTLRPDPERGSRYWVAAVVVNLTGRGNATRRMEWPEAGLETHLKVVERDMEGENAAKTLEGIATGTVGRCLLPWIPLMQGGGETAIIERWKELAGSEPDSRLRSEYGGLALVFAEAANTHPVWKEALKEWNVIQSQQVSEWKAQGRAEFLLRLLELKFPPVPVDLKETIEGLADPEQLKQWFDIAFTASSLEEFRHTAHL